MTQEQLSEKQQANRLDGWYIVEIFGHQRYAGYVTVEQLGVASMIRIDVPPLEERERTTARLEYIEDKRVPAGSKIREGAVQGYTKLFGVGAIYGTTPCTESACLKAVEEMQPRPLALVSLPAALIAAAEKDIVNGVEDGDGCEYDEDGVAF